MSELPWFKFAPDAWLAGGISCYSHAKQGLYINLCCLYWRANCKLDKAMLKRRLSLDKAELTSFLEELAEDELIQVDGDIICIKFLDLQLEDLLERKRKLSEAGKKGGSRSKRGLSDVKATPKHKEEEVEIEEEVEGEGEVEESDQPRPPSLSIDDIKTKCRVDRDETGAFVKLFKQFSRKQGIKLINKVSAALIINNGPSSPCLSHIRDYVRQHYNQIKGWEE